MKSLAKAAHLLDDVQGSQRKAEAQDHVIEADLLGWTLAEAPHGEAELGCSS